LVRDNLDEDLPVLPRAIELGVGDVLPATDGDLAALEVQGDRLVHQHLADVTWPVEAVLVARAARMERAAMRVKVTVVFDELREKVHEVAAKVRLARLLDGHTHGGV